MITDQLDIETPTREAKDLIWFPAAAIAKFRLDHWRNLFYPFDHRQPSQMELHRWWAAREEAEQVVVDGLPWSDVAVEAVTYAMFRKASGS